MSYEAVYLGRGMYMNELYGPGFPSKRHHPRSGLCNYAELLP